MSRPSWDEYFMDIAIAVSKRGTCPRKRVGAVLVRDKTIISTGYNGSPPNAKHCDDEGCVMVDGHCIATTHAELNAILSAAKRGVSTIYCVAYITCNPCFNCYRELVGAGVKRIIYGEMYRPVDYSILRESTNSAPDMMQIKHNTDGVAPDHYSGG